MRTLDRVTRGVIEADGWRSGSTLENKVAWILGRYRVAPSDVQQQYRVGPYRLDFAWPIQRIALEADGWWHQSPIGAEKDARRDAWLRERGWLIFRVHDNPDDEYILRGQVADVVAVVRAMDGYRKFKIER